MKKILLVVFCLPLSTMFLTKLHAQPKAVIPQINTISNALLRMSNDADLKNASWGFYAVDVSNGQLIASRNGEVSLAPASIQKTISTATALEIFGDDYRFTTTIQYDGTIDKATKILHGNIYIKGGGDPALGSSKYKSTYYQPDFIAQWVEAIKNLGIDSINGAVIGDATIYSTQMPPAKWSWEDLGNYYGAGASGLSIYDNLFHLTFRSPNKDGAATTIVKTEPYVPEITFYNEVKASVINADRAYIYGAPYAKVRYIRGTIPKGRSEFSIKGSIPEPAFMAAYQLDHALHKNGIKTKRQPSTIRRANGLLVKGASERKTILKTYSPALKSIVYRTNKWSMNLYAEHLINHIGYIKKGEGSTDKGIEALHTFWQSKGMDTNGFFMFDGSGLSRYNAISPKHFTYILQYMKNRGKYYESFNESLPIAGQSGTLKYMCRGTAAQGKVRAKSGSIRKVRAYAGYATTRSNREIAFCIIANNFNCKDSQMRRKLEKIMVAMALFND